MKILNLFSGIGGNRKLWEGHEVHSVDNQENILDAYKELFPNDVTILDDAYNYLLENYQNYDFIWASPPCQSHSRFIRSGRNRKPRFPDLRLYEVILFLQHNFKGKWVVENVIPYYNPLIPGKIIGRHMFWSNFLISDFVDIKQPKDFINLCNVDGSKKLKQWLGLNYTGNIYYGKNHDPSQILRNCVHPKVGKHIIECIDKNKPEVTQCDLSQNNKKEDGFPPTPKGMGIYEDIPKVVRDQMHIDELIFGEAFCLKAVDQVYYNILEDIQKTFLRVLPVDSEGNLLICGIPVILTGNISGWCVVAEDE